MQRLGFLALSASLFATPALGQSAFRLLASPERALARAADADGSGDVRGPEWAAFVASFEPSADGAILEGAVVARLLLPALDADGDGVFQGSEAAARLVRLDGDGSRTLSANEMKGAIASFGQGAGGPDPVDGVVAFGADTDGSRTLEAAEWAAACEPIEGVVPGERLASWVVRAPKNDPADASAFGPGTLLLSVKVGVDANRDGAVGRADLEAIFAGLDTDGDGALSADELTPRRRRGARDGNAFRIDDSARKREPLMPWQRSLEDALALQRKTGKPLLVCVNMDGEAASEALAAGRYRDADFVALAEGFIPLLAQPDRRNPRDYDGDGRRIPDPKFGRLVNDEHMAIEPTLFESYFRGQRVAPRHVGVSAEGEILFDLYLLNDLSVIDDALARNGVFDSELVDAELLDEGGLLASPDAAARDRLEARFLAAGEDTRTWLTAQAFDTQRETQHPQLIRMALRDRSESVRMQAVRELAEHPQIEALELYPEAMRAAEAEPETVRALGRALETITATAADDRSIRPRRLARIAEALEAHSEVIDAGLWRLALIGAPDAAPVAGPEGADFVYEALAEIDGRLEASPRDADLNTLFAQVALRGADAMIATGENPSFILQDAKAAAELAVEVDPTSTLAWAYLSRAAYMLSEFELAGDAAAKALPGLVGWADTRLAVDVLDAFAQGRTRGLYATLGTDEGWPAEWVPEVLAAYEVLLRHPLGTEAQARAGLDVHSNLETYGLQADYLVQALERYPRSGDLHNYYRWQLLRDGGARSLLDAYDGLEFPSDVIPSIRWYAGPGVLHRRRALRRGPPGGSGSRGLRPLRRRLPRVERARAGLRRFGAALRGAGLGRHGAHPSRAGQLPGSRDGDAPEHPGGHRGLRGRGRSRQHSEGDRPATDARACAGRERRRGRRVERVPGRAGRRPLGRARLSTLARPRYSRSRTARMSR